MIFFGHLGITLAVARTTDKIIFDRKPFTHYIDYRLVFLGSLLPDIIDKCILFFLAGERFSSGRMFAHSFLFIMLFFTLGIVVWRTYKKSWVLILAACSFVHQLLDVMWKQLNIFLWPVYDSILQKSIQVWSPLTQKISVKAPAMEQSEFSWVAVKKILSDPYVYISETIGVLILMYFVIILVRRKQVVRFLMTGKIIGRSKLNMAKEKPL